MQYLNQGLQQQLSLLCLSLKLMLTKEDQQEIKKTFGVITVIARPCEGDVLEASEQTTPSTYDDTTMYKSRGDIGRITVGTELYITFKWHTTVNLFKHQSDPPSSTRPEDTESPTANAEPSTENTRPSSFVWSFYLLWIDHWVNFPNILR